MAVVAGCSSTGLPSFGGSMPSWFSRSSSSPATEAQAAVPGKVLEDDCPSVDIRTGAGTLAVAAKQQEPTANDLRYQLTFIELARQCFVDGGNVRMRVGVQGRAIVGPAGAPAQVNAPIRYAVVQEGVQPKTIVTKFRRVPVALDPVNSTTFTDIEEDLSFPMPPACRVAEIRRLCRLRRSRRPAAAAGQEEGAGEGAGSAEAAEEARALGPAGVPLIAVSRL